MRLRSEVPAVLVLFVRQTLLCVCLSLTIPACMTDMFLQLFSWSVPSVREMLLYTFSSSSSSSSPLAVVMSGVLLLILMYTRWFKEEV
jgi:hypothetical protein